MDAGAAVARKRHANFGTSSAKICTDFGACIGGRVTLIDRIGRGYVAPARRQSGDRKAASLKATPKTTTTVVALTSSLHQRSELETGND